MRTRRLSLRSEHLSELTSNDLANVAGGVRQPETLRPCLTGYYPTIERPCESVQPCIAIDKTPLCPTTL